SVRKCATRCGCKLSCNIFARRTAEVKEGTIVGNIAKDLGLDKSTLKERGYRIVYGTTETPFRVNQDDGILYVNRKIDREEVCERSKVCVIDLKSGNMTIIIDVFDVNDNTPVFTQESYTVQLKENSPLGTTVIQVNATDLDEGSNGEVVYSFGNDVDAQTSARFNLNSVTGVITVAGSIDFEECSRYEIDIQASDTGAATLATDKSVIIHIVDVNDNAPEIEVTSFSHALHLPDIQPVIKTIMNFVISLILYRNKLERRKSLSNVGISCL
uniref:Cadherin domain-containing protein n=1 Tax=Dicentrarchus labrax TaxID=13489 RepID=A0A8P4K2K6_DICLA